MELFTTTAVAARSVRWVRTRFAEVRARCTGNAGRDCIAFRWTDIRVRQDAVLVSEINYSFSFIIIELVLHLQGRDIFIPSRHMTLERRCMDVATTSKH